MPLQALLNWIDANRDWLFSGLGISLLGLLWRAGASRWALVRRDEQPDARYRTSYTKVRTHPIESRLPRLLLRLFLTPDDLRNSVKLGLRQNAPAQLSLNGQVPSIDLWFQVTNFSAVDLVMDRMLLDVWFGQPTFTTTILHRYVVPSGEISDGIHVRHMLSEAQKAQIAAFQSAEHNVNQLHIYLTAYFDSKLGPFFVQSNIERGKF